jgi:hypothetical protein
MVLARAACAAAMVGRLGDEAHRSISAKPRWAAMNVSPTAVGATSTSGARQPSCSAIS